MKVLTLFISIAAVILSTADVHAQKKIGVFVHGFNGGSEKWIQESGVPGAWESDGIIDSSVVLDYETMDLATPASQLDLLKRFIAKMEEKGSPSEDQWIIVGHSLGGIIARLLYPQFRQPPFEHEGFNVVAVVSVGGPSQGASATDVDKAYISDTISRIKLKIQRAQEHEAALASIALAFTTMFDVLVLGKNDNVQQQIAAIPDYLEMARDTALGYSDHVIESQAKLLIGSNGSLISEINSYSTGNADLHPQNYLSIIGAEKDKAPIRMIGHIFSDDELKDEYETMGQFNDLRNEYFNWHVNHYDNVANYWNMCRTLKSCRENRDEARYKRDRWKWATLEIDELGTTWTKLINSYRTEKIAYQEFIPPCPDENDPYPIMYDVLSNLEVIEQECSSNPQGEYRTKYIHKIIPLKNDGVVDIHSVLWSEDDIFDDLNNVYMKDVNITPRGDDGGYNHFELRNYARAYTLREDGQVVFSEGDPNPAMEVVENWISDDLRSFN